MKLSTKNSILHVVNEYIAPVYFLYGKKTHRNRYPRLWFSNGNDANIDAGPDPETRGIPAVVAAASNSRICCRYIPMTRRPAMNEPKVWDKMSIRISVSVPCPCRTGEILTVGNFLPRKSLPIQLFLVSTFWYCEIGDGTGLTKLPKILSQRG